MSKESLSFGKNYAILNLDWITVLIDAVKDTPEGQAFIANCSRWNDAVHQKDRRPLTIFSTLSFHHGQPEVRADTPFAKLIAPFATFENGSPETQIDSCFKLDGKDILLHKKRWSATTGSSLEQILKAKGIDTSGLTLSGVVMSTVYRLFDLDYKIYVIKDNVVELPACQTEAFSKVMIDSLLPKMGLTAISLDEALDALERT